MKTTIDNSIDDLALNKIIAELNNWNMRYTDGIYPAYPPGEDGRVAFNPSGRPIDAPLYMYDTRLAMWLITNLNIPFQISCSNVESDYKWVISIPSHNVYGDTFERACCLAFYIAKGGTVKYVTEH